MAGRKGDRRLAGKEAADGVDVASAFQCLGGRIAVTAHLDDDLVGQRREPVIHRAPKRTRICERMTSKSP